MAVPGLFHPKVLNEAMKRFCFPPDMDEKQTIIAKWIAALEYGTLDEISEVSLHGDFLKDIFGRVLGYSGPVEGVMEWTLQAERHTAPGGGSADGAIGFFQGRNRGRTVAPIELKGARIDLDRNMPGRGYTPVQQGWWYASEAGCNWVIISNYRKTRLYNRYKTPAYYESFNLADLADPLIFRRFYFLFCKENFLAETGPSLIEQLLSQSDATELEITNRLYLEYKEMRLRLLEYLRSANPGVTASLLISKAQKILDRILFICFCEDRQLLPAQTLERYSKTVIPGFSKWDVLQGLFRAIDKGYPPDSIPGYNGGLFAPDPDLDSLKLPNEACDLLIQLSRYDFDSEVSVNVLGHIFEQSVSDLEALQADSRGEDMDGVPRRKREGVYYTPPYITQFIVRETLGRYLEERFQRIVNRYPPDKERGKKKKAGAWIRVYDEYRELLLKTRVLDPACGSGAFLVAAFDLLWSEYDRVNRALAELGSGDPRQETFSDLTKTILNNNLYGVDLNEESVEITKLSLWIKTSERGKPLTDLDHNIQCGNSLVDDPGVHPKAFDWKIRFPEVFQDGGFDVVIGNPPYIKLQNFRRNHAREAEWLIQRYESCRTGNFDMYLPFIERGIGLLKQGGRMGYIAQYAWIVTKYGEGLRRLISRTKTLDRFVDFKGYQVFNGVTTYTALQFFRGEPSNHVNYAVATAGDLMNLQWAKNSYDNLRDGPWALLPIGEQKLIRCLQQTCRPLGEVVEQIFQGVITGADKVYRMERLGNGRYFSRELDQDVYVEDAIMKPIVSGPEAQRYIVPNTNTYILFPYDLSGERPRLLSQVELESNFPGAWAYLRSVEEVLRQREDNRFKNELLWWQFGRNQNLDKQERPKIGCATTVPSLRFFPDWNGRFYFNHFRVNGILLPKGHEEVLWFLLGVLNSPVTNFFFKRTAKIIEMNKYEANKQYIAPLPIPNATTEQKEIVGALAQQLTELYTTQQRIVLQVLHRIELDLGPGKPSRKLERWYELGFADLHNEIKTKFKRTIPVTERDEWDEYIRIQKERLGEIKMSIDKLESEINEKIFSLYRLSNKEIAVVLEDESITSPE